MQALSYRDPLHPDPHVEPAPGDPGPSYRAEEGPWFTWGQTTDLDLGVILAGTATHVTLYVGALRLAAALEVLGTDKVVAAEPGTRVDLSEGPCEGDGMVLTTGDMELAVLDGPLSRATELTVRTDGTVELAATVTSSIISPPPESRERERAR